MSTAHPYPSCRPCARPCHGANPGTSTSCGMCHHRALPRNDTPPAPADPPRPQTAWFPWAPSPAGGSAGRPPNARLPWRVAAGGREEKGRGRRGLKRQQSSPPSSHPQNPALVSILLSVFHCSRGEGLQSCQLPPAALGLPRGPQRRALCPAGLPGPLPG